MAVEKPDSTTDFDPDEFMKTRQGGTATATDDFDPDEFMKTRQAGAATTSTAAPPTDEEIESAYGKDVSPKMRSALKRGIAPMQKPTKFETGEPQEGAAPESFGELTQRRQRGEIGKSPGQVVSDLADIPLKPWKGLGHLSESLGALGESAERKASEEETKDLAASARGEKPSAMHEAFNPASGYHILGSTGRLASGITAPESVAQIGAASVAPEVMLPYFAAQGAKMMYGPAKKYIENQINPGPEGRDWAGGLKPEEAEQGLFGGSMFAGSVAGVGEGVKTAGGVKPYVMGSALGRGLDYAVRGTPVTDAGRVNAAIEQIMQVKPPGMSEVDYRQRVQQATRDLQDIAARNSGKIKTPRDAAYALSDRIGQIEAPIGDAVKNSNIQIYPDEYRAHVHDAIQRALDNSSSKLTAKEIESAKAKVEQLFDQGDAPISLQEVEKIRRRLNEEADGYFKSRPADKRAMSSSDAEAIAQRAAASAIRDLLYGTDTAPVGLLEKAGIKAFDEQGNPMDFRAVRKRVGNLLDIRDHFEDAITRAERQGDYSAFGSMGKGPSLAAGGAGALWGLMSGHLGLGIAAGEIAKGLGDYRNTKNIAKNTEKAFRNYESTAPKTMVPPINVQGPTSVAPPAAQWGSRQMQPSAQNVQPFEIMHPPGGGALAPQQGPQGNWQTQVGALPPINFEPPAPKVEPIQPDTAWKLGNAGATHLPPPERTLPAPATPLPMPGAAELAHPEMFPQAPMGVPAAPHAPRRLANGRMGTQMFKGEGFGDIIGETAEGGPMRRPEATPEQARKVIGERTPEPAGLTPFMQDLVAKAGRRLTEQEAEKAYSAAKERGFNISKNDFMDRLQEIAKGPAGGLGTIGEAPAEVRPQTGKLGKIELNTTPAEKLEVGDTFVDEKGDPRRITDITDDGTIKTADHTMRDYPKGEIKHVGEINSPKAQLARGGMMHPAGEETEIYRPEEEKKTEVHDLGEIGEKEPEIGLPKEAPEKAVEPAETTAKSPSDEESAIEAPRTTEKLAPEQAIEALKKRVEEVNKGGLNSWQRASGEVRPRNVRILKPGEAQSAKLYDTSFLLDDGSMLTGDWSHRSHMQLAKEIGQDYLNDANAVRVVTPDSFELHDMPSEAQISEMSRLLRELPRTESTNVHNKNTVYWDFYPKEVRGYSADAVHELHETDAGSFADFRRAMDEYYKPATMEPDRVESGHGVFENPITGEKLRGQRLAEQEAALAKETKNAPEEAKKEFPEANEKVSDLTVRKDVPNLHSISSTFSEYQVQKGVREVPMSELGEPQKFTNAADNRRVRELAKEIEKSGEINPLIVVKDSEGYYVLEGGHRLGALQSLGKESVPAIVVEDLEKGKVYEQATPEEKGKGVEEKRPKNLLGVSADAKTVKGEEKGFLTGIMYLSPADTSGVMNVCANASEGCKASCLNTAGRAGIFPAILEARKAKTKWMVNDPTSFKAQLGKDIEALVRKSERLGMTPAVRINGTSDLPKLAWELADKYPDVQFYDYTKHPRPWEHTRPNYHLTFSLSETNEAAAKEALAHNINVAVPFFVKRGAPLPKKFLGVRVIDGDLTDLRFLDKEEGVVVGLRAKGRAKKDVTGFVKPNPDLVQIKPATGKPATPEEKITAPQTRHEKYLEKSTKR